MCGPGAYNRLSAAPSTNNPAHLNSDSTAGSRKERLPLRFGRHRLRTWSVSFFDGNVFGINEIVAAFAGQNASDEVANVVAGVVDRAFLCDAHPVLDLGEDLLDRVE